MNFRAVARMLGVVLLIMAGFLVVPTLVGVYFDEGRAAASCAGAAVVAACVGGLLAVKFRGDALGPDGRPRFYRREGLATVGLAWIVGGLAGALPYLFHGTLPSFVDAYFESVSGLTTTGSSVMDAGTIDGLPHAISFWRSFSQWIGGFGIVMVFVVLFPTGGRSLFRSEVPGISREAGHSRVRDSALMLMRIYLGLSVVLVVVLILVGMTGFDAMIHTFSTIANGGFSNHSESVAFFDSALVEGILIVFMLLSALNFALYDTWFRAGPRRAWQRFAGSLEAKLFVGIVAGSTLLIAAVLFATSGADSPVARAPEALRQSLFQVVCIITTAGYATADFDAWPQFCRVLLMLLAVCGACAGSTSGGLKLVRIAIVVKAALVQVRRFARPRLIHQVRVDGVSIDESVVASVTGYVVLWVCVFLGATTLIASHGHDLVSSSTAVLATLNNVGPGLGAVGPAENFGHLGVLPKVVLTVCMVFGRLEFYALIVLFMPSFWRR